MVVSTHALQNEHLEEELIDAVVEFEHDPEGWMDYAWDWGRGDLADLDGPRDWQRVIARAIKDHLADPATRYDVLQIAVASGHGIGKSALMGMIGNWAMSCFPVARVMTTANTDVQLRTKTSPEVGKWYRSSVTSHWFKTFTTSIKSVDPDQEDNWRHDFTPWSEYNTEAFAGLHNVRRIIVLEFDEASRIADSVWQTAEGALTDEDTIIIWLVFGNPTQNSGRFRECFRRFRHRWLHFHIDSRDVPGTNKRLFDRWLADHGEDSDFFKIRVRGEFPAQSAMQYISGDLVDEATHRTLRREQYQFAPVMIGVDPAWTGDDNLEIYLRQGLYSKHLLTIPKNDNDVEVANIIARLEDDHKADVVAIDAGYGTGIYSVGLSLGRTWHLVWFGSTKTPDPGFLNMRSYIWGQGRRWLQDGGVIDIADSELYEDLVAVETTPRTDGKVQLESKESLKDRGSPSPNKGDALMLTFAVPFIGHHGDKQSAAPIKAGKVVSDYDPLNQED